MEKIPNIDDKISIDLESDEYFEMVRPIKEKRDMFGPLALSGREYKIIGSSPNIEIQEGDMDTPIFKLMSLEEINIFILQLKSALSEADMTLPINQLASEELEATLRLVKENNIIISVL